MDPKTGLLKAVRHIAASELLLHDSMHQLIWRGSRRRTFACASPVNGRFPHGEFSRAIFGNQFQSRSFVGTGRDAFPIGVHHPLMANFLDGIFCHFESPPICEIPSQIGIYHLTRLTALLTDKPSHEDRRLEPS
jgi:hypothetical protein